MNMRTDYHSHILPGIDDGARDIVEAIQMLKLLKCQCVERVVATPHFYAHREKSVEDFIRRRDSAISKLSALPEIPLIVAGSEIALEHGISELRDIEKLVIDGTNLILLEPSYHGYSSKMIEDIYNICHDCNLKPIIAHIHRYACIYEESEIQKLLHLDAIFQVNNEALTNRKERKFVMRLIQEGYPVVFGSDCHNMDKRPPNFDVLLKHFKGDNDSLVNSDSIISRYFL